MTGSATASVVPDPFHVTILLFPGVTQLDFTGPMEVLHRVPGLRIDLAWKSLEPVECAAQVPPALRVLPSVTLGALQRTDLLLVPGGPGVSALMGDDEVLDFLLRLAGAARYVTSVCTGALVLGAAGLLQGYRATTHWAHHDWLALLGAIPVAGRVVVDRNRITGGGVTAGLDFGLAIVALLRNRSYAEAIQLYLEYDPDPGFNAGAPEKAPPIVTAFLNDMFAGMRDTAFATARRAQRRNRSRT